MPTFVLAHWAAILVLSVSAAVPGWAEQSSISRDPLVWTLRTVTASAQESIPFTSIKGSASAGLNGWSATKNLPSASSCVIRQVPASGQEPAQATYQCTWKYNNSPQAEKAYKALFEKILLSGDWMGRPYGGERSLKDALFDASTGARVSLQISLKQGGVVSLVVTAGTSTGFKYRSLATQNAKLSGDSTAAGKALNRSKADSDGQRNTPSQSTNSDQPAGVAVLAVVSDRAGALFVDGERKAAVVPDKVVTLKLIPGQHFVDLRDATGSKLWEKIVTIPSGEQVAERIDSGDTALSKHQTSHESQPRSLPQSASAGSDGAATSLLSGDYSCDAGATSCETATVTVLGSQFSAKLESNPHLKGRSCNGINFPPAPEPTGGCYMLWTFTGVVDGSSAEGTVSLTFPPPDSTGCGHPAESHQFKGTIKEGGRVIALSTELDVVDQHYHDARTYVWQKPHYVCDYTTVSGSSPRTFVLRSRAWSGTANLGSSVPSVTSDHGGIAGQIDEIVRSGRFTSLPPAQTIDSGGSQQPTISIENQTAYELTVMLAGPVEKSISIAAGSFQTLVLPAGRYRVVARVRGSNVLPFYGVQVYTSGSSYKESFSIQKRVLSVSNDPVVASPGS